MSNSDVKVVVSHFYPEINALTNRLESLLPLLAKAHRIRVFYLLEPGKKFDIDTIPKAILDLDLELNPVEARIYNKDGVIGRVVGETVNNWRLWRAARKCKSGVLFQSVPQLMLLPVSAVFVPFDSASRKILEIRDLTWEYLDFGKGWIGRLMAAVVGSVAIYSIGRFDEVVACTEAQAEFVRKRTNCCVRIARNGIARSKFEQLVRIPHSQSGNGSLTVSYFGTFGHAQNLITLAEAAKKLSGEKGIEITLVGAGPDERELREYINAHGLDNIDIVGKVTWEVLLEYYAAADVLYAQLKRGRAFESAEPSKLFEYFSTGKPVIYGGQGLGARLAGEFENIDVIEPDNPQQLADSIMRLRHQNLRRSLKDVSRIEENYVREQVFNKFIDEAGLT